MNMLQVTPVNIRTWARLGQCGTLFGIALPEIVKEKSDVYVLTSDLAFLSGLDRFKNAYPDRFINTGIAEQNMIGIAGGLAKEGNCVFATTYATFITMRCFEQIRHNLGYMNYNVKLIGSWAGIAMGMSGNTHYAIEDIALMRAVPNMIVLSPADSMEAAKMVFLAAETEQPVYMRLTGQLNCPVVYEQDYELKIGKAVVLEEGDDIAIIATGSMVYPSLQASKHLKELGIHAAVINMHTIKPLDTEMLDRLFTKHQLFVTVEEHSVIGGLGSAVADYKSQIKDAPPQLFIGLPDAFGKAAEYSYLLEKYDLTGKAIAGKIMERFNG